MRSENEAGESLNDPEKAKGGAVGEEAKEVFKLRILPYISLEFTSPIPTLVRRSGQ